jgi:hypothetical protein
MCDAGKEFKMAKRVVTRKVTGVGWDGNLHVRLDLALVGPVAPKATGHLYLEPSDPLAGLPPGTQIHVKICAPIPVVATTRAKKR